MSNVFLDSEFFDDGIRIHPISLALVTETSESLLLRFDTPEEILHRDPWIVENVLPHLRGPKLSREEIAERIREFLPEGIPGRRKRDHVQFWAYFSSFDWVLFCHVFGGMMRLPSNFNRCCFDLQQLWHFQGRPRKPPQPDNAHDALADAQWNLALWKSLTAGDAD